MNCLKGKFHSISFEKFFGQLLKLGLKNKKGNPYWGMLIKDVGNSLFGRPLEKILLFIIVLKLKFG